MVTIIVYSYILLSFLSKKQFFLHEVNELVIIINNDYLTPLGKELGGKDGF